MKVVMSLMALGALCPLSSFASVSAYDLQVFLGDYQLAQTVKGECQPQLSIAYTGASEKGQGEDEGILSVGDVQFAAIDQGWQESGDRSGAYTRWNSESHHEFLSSRPMLENHTERYMRNAMVERSETEVRLTKDGRVEIETERHGPSCGDRESKCLYVKAEEGKDQGQDQGPGQEQGKGQGQYQAPDQGKGQGQDQGKGQGQDQGKGQGQGPYQK